MTTQKTQTLPPRAKPAAGLIGTPPLPAGTPMILKSPSPAERAVLQEYGWKDGDPVPSNLSDVIEAAHLDATDLDNMPLPMDIRTPPLKMPKEVDISALPPEDQAKYQAVLAALTAAKTEVDDRAAQDAAMIPGASSSVNDAIRAAMRPSEIQLEDDTASDTYATGTPKTAPPAAKKTPENCPRCGWAVNDEDVVKISTPDKLAFLQSILGMVPFEKEYSLFGGLGRVRIRSLTPDELDVCFKQLSRDQAMRRTNTAMDHVELLRRYRAALQITRVEGMGNIICRPGSLDELAEQAGQTEPDETPIRAIWKEFCRSLNKSESSQRILINQVDQFNVLVSQLEVNAQNADFWQAIDTQL